MSHRAKATLLENQSLLKRLLAWNVDPLVPLVDFKGLADML